MKLVVGKRVVVNRVRFVWFILFDFAEVDCRVQPRPAYEADWLLRSA